MYLSLTQTKNRSKYWTHHPQYIDLQQNTPMRERERPTLKSWKSRLEDRKWATLSPHFLKKNSIGPYIHTIRSWIFFFLEFDHDLVVVPHLLIPATYFLYHCTVVQSNIILKKESRKKENYLNVNGKRLVRTDPEKKGQSPEKCRGQPRSNITYLSLPSILFPEPRQFISNPFESWRCPIS